MASELQRWFEDLPDRLRGELAEDFAAIVEEELVEPIRDAAPDGLTGKTRQSVRKTEGRSDTEWVVEAGGELTTKEVRAGSGASYDYALANEFGTQHQPAKPFFWSTIRARRERFQKRCDDLIARAVGRM